MGWLFFIVGLKCYCIVVLLVVVIRFVEVVVFVLGL